MHRKTKLRMANNSKGRAEMEGFKELGFELMYAGKDIQEGIELYESSHDLGSERWRAEHNIEAIRYKILTGMQLLAFFWRILPLVDPHRGTPSSSSHLPHSFATAVPSLSLPPPP